MLGVRRLCAILLTVLAAMLPNACGTQEEPRAQAAPAVYDAEGRATQPIPVRGRRPNVIVLLVDTLRADAVEPGPEGGADMPFLARWGAQGVNFSQASSAAPWTLPSIMSMFTGLLPHAHGVTGEELQSPELARLTTWAEVLRSSLHYQTAAFFGPFGAGMAQSLGHGFDALRDGFHLQQAEETLGPWSEALDKSRPFFLFLHTFEAHDPYGPTNHVPGGTGAEEQATALAALDLLGPEPAVHELVRRSVLDDAQRVLLRRHPRFRPFQSDMTRYLWSGLSREPRPELAREIETAYRTGLGWVDGLIERTVALLAKRGLLDDTLLIITGDHGEAFGEHGMLLHGRQLYDELLRVPLLMRGPAPFDRPQVITGSVGLTDLLPSVLAWLGAPAPQGIEGSSFLPLLAEDGAGRPVEAQEVRTHLHTAGLSVAVLGSVRSSAWKYVGTYDITEGTLIEEVFDLRSDPEEQRTRVGPDGLAHDLPFDAPFCKAVERVRDRLWSAAAQGDWGAQQGYSGGARRPQAPRPDPTCDVEAPR